MSREFTGKHMLTVLIVGFGIVIAVNFTMAALASSTFGGVVVKNSYVASQKFNGWLDQAEKSRKLGWEVALERDGDRLSLRTANAPADAIVTGVARHPLGAEGEQVLLFTPAGEGLYRSRQALPDGRWDIRLEIKAGSDVWRGERSLP